MTISKVSVVVASYNGERFISEFLSSVSNQSIKPAEIIITDDRSTDSTVAVAREFMSVLPLKIVENLCNLGAKGNFQKALSLANAEHIALADQDDIWSPDKLKVMVDAMRKEEARSAPGTPILVFSDLSLFFSEGGGGMGRFYSKTGKRSDCKSVLDYIVTNHIPGCAMLINRALVNVALPIPRDSIMHDWWIAICAAAVGRIVYVEEPLISYRQHDANVIGAPKKRTIRNSTAAAFSSISGGRETKSTRKNNYAIVLRAQINEILNRFSASLSVDELRTIDKIMNGYGGIFEDIKIASRFANGMDLASNVLLLRRIRKNGRG